MVGLACSELVKKLQELIVVNGVFEAGGEEIEEVEELARLNASHVLEDHVHKVSLLDDTLALEIVLLEFGI